MKIYTKKSRFNPGITLEQYKVLLARKAEAKKNNERIKYKDLVQEWGVKQYHMASAMHRGMKTYDYILWKQGELP